MPRYRPPLQVARCRRVNLETATTSRIALASGTIAHLAVASLFLEIDTWPKPGLVSQVDDGSHHDMDASMLRASAASLRPFFAMLFDAGAAGCSMAPLRAIGLRAEASMLRATGGINTHRGAIFGLGLLCAAAGVAARAGIARSELGEIVHYRWADEIRCGSALSRNQGSIARSRFGVSGAPGEAAEGFPSIYRVALPALRTARKLRFDDEEAARVQACFALIASVDDTNLLHRGGREGLSFAQAAAAGFLRDGGVAQPEWRSHAAAIHSTFVAQRLSPGGCADLLAMTLFVDALESR